MEQKPSFTLEEANQKAPRLEAQLQDIASLRKDLSRLNGDIQELLREGRGNGHGGIEHQRAAKRDEVAPLADKLAELMQAVHDNGIILRDPDHGLLDLPALRDTQDVYLCWLLSEDRVRFWHDVGVGFVSRQPF